MRRLAPLAALVLAMTTAGMAIQPVHLLRVATVDGEILVCHRLGRGDPVTLVFTHSMYGGEVRETWSVDGDALVRERIVAERAAAAEYYATDGETRPVDGGYEVISPPLRADALSFRIDHIGNHRLRLEGREISLASHVEGSAGATMSAAQVPLVARMIDGDAGCGP